jgi:RNA polymerase sigma-70 factor (ECF subfamily)
LGEGDVSARGTVLNGRGHSGAESRNGNGVDVNFERIFDEVYPQLFRYSLRVSGDADLAEDTAQEAFVRLLDQDGSGGVSGGIPGARAWLFTVALRLLRDRARVEGNRARLLEAHPVRPDLPDAARAPDEEAVRSAEIRRVRQALEVLGERDRTLLLLREEGFSYAELAAEVGVQPGSVGTLLARARRRLMDELNGGTA